MKSHLYMKFQLIFIMRYYDSFDASYLKKNEKPKNLLREDVLKNIFLFLFYKKLKIQSI